jgi:hypothetical protein
MICALSHAPPRMVVCAHACKLACGVRSACVLAPYALVYLAPLKCRPPAPPHRPAVCSLRPSVRHTSEVVTARNAANEPAIHSVETSYGDVIPALETLLGHVGGLLDKANKYMRYQEILRLPVRGRPKAWSCPCCHV